MEPATAGAEIINEAYNLITGDRQNDYDHPLDDYSRTAEIFGAITGRYLTAEEAILFMVCVKLSRLWNELESDLDVPDNTRDAIGYLGCLNMVRTRRKTDDAEIERILKTTSYRFKTGESTWG
jgi:hypothetical protein